MKHLVQLAVITLATGLAFAGPSKISRDLEGKDPKATVDVIVQFKQAPSEADHERIRGRSGRVKTRLDSIRGGAYSLPASALADLADDPNVAYISADREVQACSTSPHRLSARTWPGDTGWTEPESPSP